MIARSIPGRRLGMLLVAWVVMACGGDSAVGPEPVPPPVPVASVTVNPGQRNLVVGDRLPMAAVVKDASNRELHDRAVTWTSSNAAVATVSSTGEVEAKGAGTATITASSEGKDGSAQLTVALVPVAWVQVSPSIVTLEWNGSQQLSVGTFDAMGIELPGRTVTWISSNPAVASVDTTGKVTAHSMGIIYISAISEGRSDRAQVEVARVPVSQVVMTESVHYFEKGEGKLVAVRVEDALGRAVTDRSVTWSSSDQSILFVSADGFASSLKTGTVTITATSEGKSATATAKVIEPPTHDLIYGRPLLTGGSEIMVLSLVPGATPLRLNAGNVSREPSPSPDGTRYVFAVSQIDLTTGQSINDLFMVNRNGLNMKRMTSALGIEEQPAWSPDGSKIAFSGTNPATQSSDIYVMNADGTGLVSLTADLGIGINEMQPAWSPDGQSIAFSATLQTNGGNGMQIWVMRADGSGRRQPVSDLGYDMYPTWSPAGDKIAFQRYGSGVNGADIMIVAAAGGVPTRLALPGDQYTPAWSPDGNYIAFTARVTGFEYQLFTMQPDGTGVRLRTTDPQWGGGSRASWIVR
jgi:Tol biopolymer transport system component